MFEPTGDAQSSIHRNGPHTHLELRQRIYSFLPRALVVSRHTICQGGPEANAKGGFGTSGKLFSEYQGGALSARIELCLNWRKLCTRGGDEGRWAEVQHRCSIKGDDLSRFHDVEANNG